MDQDVTVRAYAEVILKSGRDHAESTPVESGVDAFIGEAGDEYIKITREGGEANGSQRRVKSEQYDRIRAEIGGPRALVGTQQQDVYLIRRAFK